MDYKQARKVLIYTLVLNWIVSMAKIAYGIFTGSASMTADGFHSFADGNNNIVGLVGLYISSRPIDKTHPYGHQKYETLTALGIGVVLILLALNILKDAIQRINSPVLPEVNLGSFAVMFFTIAVNVFVMYYERNEGKRLNSDFLVADSHHTRSDIFVSCSVLGTLLAVKLGMPILDTIMAGFIAVFIAYSAFEIFWQTTRVLSDAAVIDPAIIENIVKGFSDVENCHKVRTRGKEGSICVDLHIWVKPNMHIDRSHKLAHNIESKLKQEIPGIVEVIVHIEPAPVKKNK
jgi:cation diffusion facilitator family transporter